MSLTTPPHFMEKDLAYYLREQRNSNDVNEELQTYSLKSDSSPYSIAVLVDKKYLGSNDPLGHSLLISLIEKLLHTKAKPRYIIFMHEAVGLCKEGSPLHEDLMLFLQQGSTVFACEKSMEQFGISEESIVGQPANMTQIASVIAGAWKVIHL